MIVRDNDKVPRDRSWDWRTWLLAVFGTSAIIFVLWLETFPQLERTIGKRLPFVLWVESDNPISSVVAAVFLLGLPVLLTVVARRKPFLWGVFPFASLDAFNAAYAIARRQPIGIAFDVHQLLMLPIWWVLSGIGLLIRYFIRRRRKPVTSAATETGAWPPAPKVGADPPTPPRL